MPSVEQMRAFESDALDRLQSAINAYYDYVEGNDTPGRRNVALARASAELQRGLRELHTQAAVLGADGKLTTDERDLLADIIAQDQDYMQGFIDHLPELSREQALARCNAYVATIRSTANELSVIDLPTLPMYPQDDRLDCGHFCKCVLIVRKVGDADWDITWGVDPDAEHCESCLELSQTWNPLQIRNGEVIEVKAITAGQIKRVKALVMIALGKVAA